MRSADLGMISGLPEKYGKSFALEMYKRGNFSHNFELKVKESFDNKVINIPIYLSLGTEYNSAALSMVLPGIQIFGQHRCHSLYLNFGGRPEALRDELWGLSTGCCGGMSGSNAIQGKEINMFGHGGLMGEQIPIAVGAAFASNKLTLTICGDGSVEEDYVYPALGWAASKNLPVIFICEDNDLSILTKVDVRRTWNPVDVCKGFGMFAADITDDPWLIAYYAEKIKNSGKPGFLNIRTVRHLWHAGTGVDEVPEWNRHELIKETLLSMDLKDEMKEIEMNNLNKVNRLWL